MTTGVQLELTKLGGAVSAQSEMSDEDKSSNGWNEHIQVGDINPEYSHIPNQNAGRHQSLSSEPTKAPEYDTVPTNSAPPLPNPRRTVANPVYETRGNTFTHPTTLDHHQQPRFMGETEIEPDYKERNPMKCFLLTCLAILVAAGLALAITAVALVLLMWFGVHVPGCPASPTSSTAVREQNCSCTG